MLLFVKDVIDLLKVLKIVVIVSEKKISLKGEEEYKSNYNRFYHVSCYLTTHKTQ